MSIPELLARLSTGCTQRIEVPGSTPPELTQSDIAAALTGSPKGAFLLVRVKYAFDTDPSTLQALERHVWVAAVDLAIQHNWQLEKHKNTLRNLARLSLHLYANPPKCRYCSGRGHRPYFKGVIGVCKTCGGTGAGSMTDTEKSRLIQVHRSRWKRCWEPRLNLLLTNLDDWEAEAIRIARKRLFKKNKYKS